MDALKACIWTTPVVDNHAHNVLNLDGLHEEDLIAITSEASEQALEDAPTSLAHIRGAKQLRTLYELPATANWEAIVQKRRELLEQDPEDLIRKCLQGTHTILVDDGYEDPENVFPYQWHDKFTVSPCKRIFRIEEAAASILESFHEESKLPVDDKANDEQACREAWASFIAAFEETISSAIEDKDVVGFKSVVCYQTGLDVELEDEGLETAQESFQHEYLPNCIENEFEILAKPVNDALVRATCKLITAALSEDKDKIAKPFQFHTGLGSNNMSLLKSNPAFMQPLIDAYSSVPFVLLHCSYPFTREAGYLASVYKNCFLDLGLVWPEVSRDGQETAIRQALELSPWSKLLWSTDGHGHPETYFLSNKQGRAALEKVMCEYVLAEDLTAEQAMCAVKKIYFENASELYGLGLKL